MSAPFSNHQVVLAALERILAWPEMARSPQLGRFLDYIVRRTLDGDEQAIKAYSIAVDVFGRTGDFDPQADPIVRVQARRLRGLLEQYYGLAGLADDVRISLPVGRYVPVFEMAGSSDGPVEVVAASEVTPTALQHRPKGQITLSWFTLLVMTIGIAALAYALSTWEPRQLHPVASLAETGPSVTIVEFKNLAGDTGRPVFAGLAVELVTDLEAFEDIDARYGGSEAIADAPEAESSDFVLTGIVRRADRAVQYSAILTETASGEVVWSRTIALDEQRAMQPDALDEISRTLSLVLGSPRGPLHLPARRALTSREQIEGPPTLYLCRVLFDLYREAQTTASGSRAADCYAGLAETDRQAPSALAATASLTGEGMMAGDATALAAEDRLRIAGASLERAMALAPLSGFIWEQQGRWLEAQGQGAAASGAYASAIQLNPANADALAAAARLLALQGNLAEAAPLATKAIAGAPMPPPWYFLVPTLVALQEAHFSMAISNAQTYAVADPELGSVLAVVAASAAGNAGVVNRYLPQVLEVAAFRAAGILPRLRERVGDLELLTEISMALSTAGVPERSLSAPF